MKRPLIIRWRFTAMTENRHNWVWNITELADYLTAMLFWYIREIQ
ncbi:MAG: hypothetical protein ACR2PB_02005 [Desulfocapsaceae bacterium]